MAGQETLLAFLLAMGLAAHALDELHGRPLRTGSPTRLIAVAIAGLAGAVALGIDGMIQISPWLGVFIVVGAFLVACYNLELFGGASIRTVVRAGVGGLPGAHGVLRADGGARRRRAARRGRCATLSAAQRALSTPAGACGAT